MSEMKPDIDLDRLARAPTVAPPKRRWLPRLVPLLLLLAFGALLISTLTDFGRGAVQVTLVRPQPADGEAGGGAASGGGELQRSGWIEPDPYPQMVNPLVAGVVSELLVLEGDTVRAGQEVARLDDAAARLAVASAQANRVRAQFDVARASVDVAIARRRFDAALAVKEALALAEAGRDGRLAEQTRRIEAVRRSGAAVTIAEEELAVARDLAEHGGAGPRQVELAAAKVEAERAARAMVQAEAELAASEVARSEAMLQRAQQEFELRLDDRAALESAEAALAVAQAMQAQAEASVEESALTFERHVVRTPTAGVVLQRMAVPGAAIGGPEHAALLTLYDPQQLRVRVDVEQTEVAKLTVGGAVTLRAPTRPDRPYRGTITRLVRQANVEKVTLQVHVHVDDPDEQLRPEMLVETRFALASAPAVAAATGASDGGRGSAAFWIPARLLIERDGATSVWLIDGAHGRAALRRVTVLRRDGERALIGSGLNLTDKLIDGGREQLRDGARVEVAGTER